MRSFTSSQLSLTSLTSSTRRQAPSIGAPRSFTSKTFTAVVAVLLTLNLGFTATAQATPTPAGPAPAAMTPPVAQPMSQPATPWQPWDPGTMGWQAVGGTAGAAAGGLAGLLLAAGYIQLKGKGDGWNDLGFLLLGGMAGGVGGLGAGTWWAGELNGGNGSLGWTIGGSFVGVIGGFAAGSSATDSPEMGLALALVGGLAGGIAAYHLTADATAPGPVSAAMRVGTDGKVRAGVPLALPYAGADGKVTGWQLSLVSGRF